MKIIVFSVFPSFHGSCDKVVWIEIVDEQRFNQSKKRDYKVNDSIVSVNEINVRRSNVKHAPIRRQKRTQTRMKIEIQR